MSELQTNIDADRGLGFVVPLLARWNQLRELVDLRDFLESEWTKVIIRSDDLLKRKANIAADAAELAKDEAELNEECHRLYGPLAAARSAADELHRLVRKYPDAFSVLDIDQNPKGSI